METASVWGNVILQPGWSVEHCSWDTKWRWVKDLVSMCACKSQSQILFTKASYGALTEPSEGGNPTKRHCLGEESNEKVLPEGASYSLHKQVLGGMASSADAKARTF